MSQQGQPRAVARERRGVRQQCSTGISNKQDAPARVNRNQRQKSPFPKLHIIVPDPQDGDQQQRARTNMEARAKKGGEPEKVGVGFAAVTSAYRAWAEHQRKEGEGWRRMLESSGAEMVREVKEHEASIDAQRTDLQRILRDFDREKLSRLDEKEEVMFDVVTHHKQRILDEWDEPDDIWTMQAELWAETCTICRIREGVWARHDWRVCRENEDDVEAVHRSYVGVAEHLEEWTSKEQVGLGGRCVGCDRGRMECWVKSCTKECRFEGVVQESVAAILGTESWFVQE
jgi:hypothetical protein